MGLPLGLLGLGGFRLGLRADLAQAGERLGHSRDLDRRIFCGRRRRLHEVQPLHAAGLRAAGDLRRGGARRAGDLGAQAAARGSARLTGLPWYRRDLFASRLAQRATAHLECKWWGFVTGALALAIFAATAFNALALTNIYSQPNTRVQASEWIYDHVPAGSVLTNEIWDDPLPIRRPRRARRSMASR